MDLAQHLGLAAQRPERDFGRGSDVLWMTGHLTYAVIEAKSGATGTTIWKKDINQLAGSENWAQNEYGADAQITPVMMHQSHIVEKSGTPPAAARVLGAQKLTELKAALTAFATALAQDEDYKDAAKVTSQLEQHQLRGSEIVKRYTRAAVRSTT